VLVLRPFKHWLRQDWKGLSRKTFQWQGVFMENDIQNVLKAFQKCKSSEYIYIYIYIYMDLTIGLAICMFSTFG
jgi:hypothetical protein